VATLPAYNGEIFKYVTNYYVLQVGGLHLYVLETKKTGQLLEG